jgi:hypothetical protein
MWVPHVSLLRHGRARASTGSRFTGITIVR